MTAARVVEPIDILEYRPLGLAFGFPAVPSDQLCLDGFEERFCNGIIVAISFAAHRYFETMLAQDFLIIVRAILAATIHLMNGVTVQTYYRWRKEYGGMSRDQLKRLKLLESENTRLRRAVSDLTLDKMILTDAAGGNY